MSSIRKLHYCTTPGNTEKPVGTPLFRSAYAAARDFLKHHPDFDVDTSSYFGKQVFVGLHPEKLYSFVIGTADVSVGLGNPEPTVLCESHEVQQMVYRDLAYDDFVSGLPVLTIRKEYHEPLTPLSVSE